MKNYMQVTIQAQFITNKPRWGRRLSCCHKNMQESAAERRLGENEVIFRQANENAITALESARQQEQDDDVKPSDEPDIALYFYCECADDTCKERVKMLLSEYEANHRQSNQFVIMPGHEIPEIEKVTKKEPKYYVVQKYMTPPQHPDKLHSKKKNL